MEIDENKLKEMNESFMSVEFMDRFTKEWNEVRENLNKPKMIQAKNTKVSSSSGKIFG